MTIPTTETTAVKGMACMLAGTFLLATQDGITKWLTTDFHAGEIMFYRGIWMFPVLLVLAHFYGGLKSLRANRPIGLTVRGVAALVTSIFVTLAFVGMPLAEASALIFVSPLILTAMSPFLLKERVGWQRWSAVIVGFLGILVMIQPGTAGFNAWVFFPLVAALGSASRDVLTRLFCREDAAATVMFYSAIAACLGGVVTLPFGTHMPTLPQCGWFILAGTLVSLAHLLIVMAFQFAQGAAVSPLKYLSLVWSAAIGYMVWGDVPGPLKLVGAGLVVGAGLFVLYRETKQSRQVTAASGPS